MFDPIKPYIHLIEALSIVVVALTLWFGGAYHQRGIDDAKWNKERLATAQAVDRVLTQQKAKAENYAMQLESANVIIAALNEAIATAASHPVPRVVCHTVSSPGPVSKDPSGSGSKATGPGATDNVWGPDFRPADDERRLHIAFAKGLSACYDALNRWPN